MTPTNHGATTNVPVFRLGLLLWLAGMAGVISSLWLPLPVPEGVELPFPLWVARLVNLLQPAVLLTLAVWAGIKLAPAVGLGAPAFEAAASGGPVAASLRPQVVPGLVGGFAGGALLLLFGLFAPASTGSPVSPFDPPLVTKLLYGGITEELLVRWGLMTFLLWALHRLAPERVPRTVLAWSAIAVAAILFGVLHLPAAFALIEQVTPYLITYVIAGNTLFGLLAGYLYWRYGLEAAIITHAGSHLVATVAAPVLPLS